MLLQLGIAIVLVACGVWIVEHWTIAKDILFKVGKFIGETLIFVVKIIAILFYAFIYSPYAYLKIAARGLVMEKKFILPPPSSFSFCERCHQHYDHRVKLVEIYDKRHGIWVKFRRFCKYCGWESLNEVSLETWKTLLGKKKK